MDKTAKMHWFRSHHGEPTETRWLLIARKANCAPGVVSALWWALLDHASQSRERGSVVSFDVESYAEWSGFGEEELTRILAAMREKGVIVDGKIAEWGEKQPKREDDSNERVRAFRERKAAESSLPLSATDPNDATPGNESLALPGGGVDGVTQGNALVPGSSVTSVTLYSTLSEENKNDPADSWALVLPAIQMSAEGRLAAGTPDDPVIVNAIPLTPERWKERDVATNLRLAAKDAVDAAHRSVVGGEPTLAQSKVYDAWLKTTTSTTIIDALAAAGKKVSYPSRRFAYAMGILQAKQREKSLPGPNTIIPQMPTTLTLEMAWNPAAVPGAEV